MEEKQGKYLEERDEFRPEFEGKIRCSEENGQKKDGTDRETDHKRLIEEFLGAPFETPTDKTENVVAHGIATETDKDAECGVRGKQELEDPVLIQRELGDDKKGVEERYRL